MSRYTTENSVVFKPGYHRAINHTSNSRDGTANAAADLEEFIYDNPNSVVKVESRIPILLSNFGQQGILTGAESVKIDFGQTKINYLNTLPSIHLDNTGNASIEYTVSAISNVVLNSYSTVTRLTLSAASGVQAHQWVAVYSSDANPSTSGGIMGQIHQVLQDETGDPYVYLCGIVGKISKFTANIKMRILSNEVKVSLTGGIFQAFGNADDLAITTRSAAIKLLGHVDPRVRKVEFVSPWAQGVWLQCTAAAEVDVFTMRDTLNNAASNGYSYGVLLYGMNGNSIVKNGTVRNARHPGGTTGGNNNSTTTWYDKGEPTYGVIQHITGHNCYGSVTDSHEEGCFMRFSDIVSNNAIQDERAAFVGRAHQSRSFNETICNVSGVGGIDGISVAAIDHGELDIVTINNCNFRGLKNGGDGRSIRVDSTTIAANKRKVLVNDVTSTDCDMGLYAGQNTRVRMNNMKNYAVDVEFDCYGGSDVIVTGTLVSDHQDTTASGATYIGNLRSDATNGGASLLILADHQILRGSATNKPTQIFTEADAAANKTYYSAGYTTYNPNSVTALLVTEAGATTLVESTKVLKV